MDHKSQRWCLTRMKPLRLLLHHLRKTLRIPCWNIQCNILPQWRVMLTYKLIGTQTALEPSTLLTWQGARWQLPPTAALWPNRGFPWAILSDFPALRLPSSLVNRCSCMVLRTCEYNQKYGTIQTRVTADGRQGVRLSCGKRISVKISNLMAASSFPGMTHFEDEFSHFGTRFSRNDLWSNGDCKEGIASLSARPFKFPPNTARPCDWPWYSEWIPMWVLENGLSRQSWAFWFLVDDVLAFIMFSFKWGKFIEHRLLVGQPDCMSWRLATTWFLNSPTNIAAINLQQIIIVYVILGAPRR